MIRTARPMIKLALNELEKQLKEATLNYVRYGVGRDRFVELQARYRQYVEAARPSQHETPVAERSIAA